MKKSDNEFQSANTRPLGQFTLEGEFVAYHDSVLAAAKAVRVQPLNIIAAFIGKRATAGGFIWADSQQLANARSEHYKAAPKENTVKRTKAVIQLSLSGKRIAGYASASEAGKATGVHPYSISLAARGEIDDAGGFLWRYDIWQKQNEHGKKIK